METILVKPEIQLFHLVLSLPTRNGNFKNLKEKKPYLFGFEPTYKEWKLFQVVFPGPAVLCFEPTYKEWKLKEPGMNLVVPGKGFEPTYKEWKRNGGNGKLPGANSFKPTYKEWKHGELRFFGLGG